MYTVKFAFSAAAEYDILTLNIPAGRHAVRKLEKDGTAAMSDNSDKQSILIELINSNLEHARHVENERMTFMALFLVGLGLIMDYANNTKYHETAIYMGAVLILLNLICTRLIFKWNTVFKRHQDIAKNIMQELESLGYDQNHDVNRYYLFDNDKYSDDHNAKAADSGLAASARKIWRRISKTHSLFVLFNLINYIIIAIFMFSVF